MDGLRLGINEVARRGRGFGDDHAFSGLQALDADLTVFVRPVDTVAVANQGPVRIHDLKFRVGQGDTGVDGADLADQEDAVRHILKPHGNDALLSAVGQEDGFRGLDDAVPIRRVDFFQNIGAALEPGPDGSAIFSGHFLADSSSARSAGSAEIA